MSIPAEEKYGFDQVSTEPRTTRTNPYNFAADFNHMARRNPLATFDYRVDCDDFLVYELGRLIEEDRASLEDEEFRRVIAAGIHEHIERRLDIRSEIASRIRSSGLPAG